MKHLSVVKALFCRISIAQPIRDYILLQKDQFSKYTEPTSRLVGFYFKRKIYHIVR